MVGFKDSPVKLNFGDNRNKLWMNGMFALNIEAQAGPLCVRKRRDKRRLPDVAVAGVARHANLQCLTAMFAAERFPQSDRFGVL